MHEIPSRWLSSSAGDDQLTEHPAVHSIDEARIHVPSMPGLMVKNRFVRDEKGWRHLLVMASPERLLRHLGIAPAPQVGCCIRFEGGAVPRSGAMLSGDVCTRAGFVQCVERGAASSVTA